ncbi:cytochrome b562 [Pseudoalteromonas umbrosa]|uniref:cytochrome b562 n=1 Tax=Pseudoalteromonas umbrosa TaxID=3048489 RepID=UPI0024C27B6D|nr:cytochrome b562 [Pseudoalteromonas sp. B95]MDK1287844.1 cytochrome b562 [Pseudoalteromonas sp. B95]
MKFVFVIWMLFSFSAFAQPSELNQLMKKMGLEYKLAVKAQSADVMRKHLAQFILLVEHAKTHRFQQDKKQKSIEGLNLTIDEAKKALASADKGQLEVARKALKNIDSLRTQYHKLHEPPSFWQLFFGN